MAYIYGKRVGGNNQNVLVVIVHSSDTYQMLTTSETVPGDNGEQDRHSQSPHIQYLSHKYKHQINHSLKEVIPASSSGHRKGFLYGSDMTE